MNKKNKISLAALAVVAGVGTAVTGVELINNQHKVIKAEECEHKVVQHYVKKGIQIIDSPAPGDGSINAEFEKGYVEHYACCGCHHAFADANCTIDLGETGGGETTRDSKNIDIIPLDWINGENSIHDIVSDSNIIIFGKNDTYKSEAENLQELNTEYCGKPGYETLITLYHGKNDDEKMVSYILSDYRIGACDKDFDTFKGGQGFNGNGFSDNLEEIRFENFDTYSLSDFCEWFAGDLFLKSVSLESWDLDHSLDQEFWTSGMFSECASLETIYATDKLDFSIVDLDDHSEQMFNECQLLSGGDGTTYEESCTNREYARIDDLNNDQPGYFTRIEKHELDWNSSKVRYFLSNLELDTGTIVFTRTIGNEFYQKGYGWPTSFEVSDSNGNKVDLTEAKVILNGKDVTSSCICNKYGIDFNDAVFFSESDKVAIKIKIPKYGKYNAELVITAFE